MLNLSIQLNTPAHLSFMKAYAIISALMWMAPFIQHPHGHINVKGP